MCPAWYALQIRPHREAVAGEGLRLKGYEVFVPTYSDRRFRSGRIRKTELPLFPGYLFCRCGDSSAGKIVTTPGVIRMLSLNGAPVQIPDEEVERIQRIVSSQLYCQAWRFVADGTLVRIESGPLKSVEGILMCGEEKRRLIVSVVMLQRSVAVILDEDTKITTLSPRFGVSLSRRSFDCGHRSSPTIERSRLAALEKDSSAEATFRVPRSATVLAQHPVRLSEDAQIRARR
jgi:transcription antitermination factor NusG